MRGKITVPKQDKKGSPGSVSIPVVLKHTTIAVVVLVAGLSLIGTKVNAPQIPEHANAQHITVLEASQDTINPEVVNVPSEVLETPVEPPVPSEPVISWQDNPNNCTDSQWIAKDAPFNCIDKPKPVAKAAPSSHPVDCEAYRPLLAQYNWNVETMLIAMRKESSCNPNAVGDNYPINGLHAVSCGLLQVRTLAGRPSCEALKDPVTNIEWSYKIWLSQGYRAWSTLR